MTTPNNYRLTLCRHGVHYSFNDFEDPDLARAQVAAFLFVAGVG